MKQSKKTSNKLPMLCAALLAAYLPAQAQAAEADSVRNNAAVTVTANAGGAGGDIEMVRKASSGQTDTTLTVGADGVTTNKNVVVGGQISATGGSALVSGGGTQQSESTTSSGSASLKSGGSAGNSATVASKVDASGKVSVELATTNQDGKNTSLKLQDGEATLNAVKTTINGKLDIAGATDITGATTISGKLASSDGSGSLSVANDAVGLKVQNGGQFSANTTSAQASMGSSSLQLHNQQVSLGVQNGGNLAANLGGVQASMGNTSLQLQSQQANMTVQGGGALKLDSGSASLTGSGAQASNGTGTAVAGAGGLTVYNSAQTVGNGSTINNTLAGKQYQNKLNGNTYIDGNVYINGTLDYVSNNSASTTVVGVSKEDSKLRGATQTVQGSSKIELQGSNGAKESSAALTLTNGLGNTHGVQVYEDRTQLSGGAHSTDMVLDDNGAHFSNRETGQAVKVTGVANGTNAFDAVNYQQLQALRKDMAQGIASSVAMSSIPQVDSNKRFSFGMGVGGFNGHNAVAAGISMRVAPSAVVNARVASGNGGSVSYGAGAAFSW